MFEKAHLVLCHPDLQPAAQKVEAKHGLPNLCCSCGSIPGALRSRCFGNGTVKLLWKRHSGKVWMAKLWERHTYQVLWKIHRPKKEKCFGKDTMNQESEFGKSLEKDWCVQVSPS